MWNLNPKVTRHGQHCVIVRFCARNYAREYLLVDLLCGDSEFSVAWPGRAGSRKYLFTLPVDGSGVTTIRNAILDKSAFGDYHIVADDLAQAINKARLELKRMNQ